MCKVYTKEKSEPLEARLEEFSGKSGITFDNETNITRICNILHIANFALPLDEEGLDGVIIIDKDMRAIAINENLDVQDARFVIAHELAHYITESEKKSDGALLFAERDKIFHGKEKRPEENDMDYLAAAMLVPKNQFLEELKSLKIDLISLADRTESGVREKISPFIIDFLARRYNVKEDVIVRRIAEVSFYVG